MSLYQFSLLHLNHFTRTLCTNNNAEQQNKRFLSIMFLRSIRRMVSREVHVISVEPACLIKATKEFYTTINMDISWLTPSFCSTPGHLVNTKLPHILTVEAQRPIRKEQKSRVTELSYLPLCFTRTRQCNAKKSNGL